jgi:hypothetical protein
MVRSMRISIPIYYDGPSDTITVAKPWSVVGWSDAVDERFMYNRENNIGLMMFHPEEGEAWQHYPVFEDDFMETYVFVSRSC